MSAVPPVSPYVVDGGQRGCGELLLALAREVRSLPPGTVVHLRTLDAGAPVEIPAWCRLTGNELLGSAVTPDGDGHGDRTFRFRTPDPTPGASA